VSQRTMRHTLKLLFNRDYRIRSRMNRDIQAYLDALPACFETVQIAGPSYDKHQYNCIITMPASSLLVWSLMYVDEPIIMSWYDEVVRQSLPIWLRQAGRSNGEKATELPIGAFKIIDRRMVEWVKSGAARVWCYSCKQSVTDVSMSKEDKNRVDKSYTSWTDIWRCDAGHTLYKAKSEMRITYISQNFD